MKSETVDMVATAGRFVASGYDHEYRLEDGNVFDLRNKRALKPEDVQVDAALRLESGTGDAANIYAISDQKTQSKGLLIDRFDIFDGLCDGVLKEKLLKKRDAQHLADDDVPSRYGLRKVFKEEFDRDPERYVFRIGYPDFPKCPFDQSYSALGFDSTERAYVWLVTSILKDPRLDRIRYQHADEPGNQPGAEA